MTIKELSELYYLNREIEMTERRLAETEQSPALAELADVIRKGLVHRTQERHNAIEWDKYCKRRAARLKARGLVFDAETQEWITVNGTPIPLEDDGGLGGAVGNKIESESEEKEEQRTAERQAKKEAAEEREAERALAQAEKEEQAAKREYQNTMKKGQNAAKKLGSFLDAFAGGTAALSDDPEEEPPDDDE